MKKIFSFILVLLSFTSYSQTLYTGTIDSTVKVPSNVAGAIRTIYAKDLSKDKVTNAKHIADSITLRALINALPTATSTTTFANKSVPNLGTPAANLTTIEAWGDSRTQGTGGFTPYWPTQLASLTGYTVNNRGIFGETTTQIKARFLASTTAQKNCMTIFWGGRNDIDGTQAKYDTIKANYAAMVAALGHSSYLILGEIPSPGSEIASDATAYNLMMKYNKEMAAIYGNHFIDIHAFLLSQYDPSNATDIANVGKMLMPATLTSDGTHFTLLGNTKIASRILQQISVLDFSALKLTPNTIADYTRTYPYSVPSEDGTFARIRANYLQTDENIGALWSGNNVVFRFNKTSQSVHAGRSAGYNNLFGTNVTAAVYIGDQAGKLAPNYGTIIGWNTGMSVTGGFNVLYGWSTAGNLTSGGSNIIIGNNINAPSATASNQLNIGNLIFGQGLTGSGSTAAGTLGIRTPAVTTTTLALPASTTTTSSLNIASGVAPTSPQNGDMWSDGSNLFIRLGGVTYTLQKS